MSNLRPTTEVKDRKHPEITKQTFASGTVRYRVRLLGVDRRKPSYAEAVALVAQVRSDHARGIKGSTATVTVEEVADLLVAAWQYDVELGQLGQTTIGEYEDKLKYLRKAAGDLPLVKLTVAKMQEIIVHGRAVGYPRKDGKPGRPWGNDTHRKFLIVLNKFFDYAVAHHLAPVNLSRTLKAPSQKAATRVEAPHLTLPEMADIKSIIDHHPLGVAFRLGLAGFRRGEVAGLRWSDIHFDEDYLTIANTRTESYRDGKCRIVEKPPKSGRARDYPLADPDLVAGLKAARHAQRENRLALGQDYDPSPYVVVQADGRPYTPGTISKAWKKFLAGEELRHVKFHGTRHSFATASANAAGSSVHNVKDMLGHASLKTTGIYLHADRESMTRAASATFQAMAEAGSRRGPGRKSGT